MVVIVLIILGLCFGSFINALVWRVHEQSRRQSPKAKNELSVLRGRSMCPHCRHELAAKDLVPVFSWLALRGRCRYCHKPISRQYPLVEASTAAVFAASYLLWPAQMHGAGRWLLFTTWLAVSLGLIALLIYDLKWLILPNRILYPTFFVALAGKLAYIGFFSHHKLHSLGLLALSVIIASGIFWLLFNLSNGRWIGYGDVRLGLVTGTVLASPSLSLLMIFLASILGTLASLPGLLTGRRSFTSKIPFGPFLIAATGLSLLFGPSIINWYKNLTGL
jgi:prepilin signal peptidase PulO-like enzyme (type II secretory pathway)